VKAARAAKMKAVAVPSLSEGDCSLLADSVLHSLLEFHPHLWGLPPFDDCTYNLSELYYDYYRPWLFQVYDVFFMMLQGSIMHCLLNQFTGLASVKMGLLLKVQVSNFFSLSLYS